jgi:hypothetical protein
LLKEELIIDDNLYKECSSDRLQNSTITIINTISNSIKKILEETKTRDSAYKADKIRILYNKIDNRINTIARTESCAVINEVRYSHMKLVGIKHHKWLTKSEGRHKHLHSKVVRIGDSFSEDFTLRYPLDSAAPIGEVINCKCCTAPVVVMKE